MTTLYRPVLIESIEQAEALPDGSMAYLDTTDAYRQSCRLVATKHRGAWRVDDRRDSVIGWSALVPIEAEEDFQKAGGASVYDGGMGSWPDRTRLVTAWEEA